VVDIYTQGGIYKSESVSTSERQDEEQMPRETRTRQGRTPPTGDPHRGDDPAEDPPPEGRATQGTHTEHTQTCIYTQGEQGARRKESYVRGARVTLTLTLKSNTQGGQGARVKKGSQLGGPELTRVSTSMYVCIIIASNELE